MKISRKVLIDFLEIRNAALPRQAGRGKGSPPVMREFFNSAPEICYLQTLKNEEKIFNVNDVVLNFGRK